MTPALHQTALRLLELHSHFWALTDLSVIPKIPESQIVCGPVIGNMQDNYGQWFSGIEQIQEATRKGVSVTFPDLKINFWRDGRKIEAFARAYNERQRTAYKNLGLEIDWVLTKSVCRWIVKGGEALAKQKCTELLNTELDETDFEFFTQHGCGFLKKHEMETDRKEVARVFVDCRYNLEKHLTRLWLELFTEQGIESAKEYMREFWKPESNEAKEKINAAYIAAKHEFLNPTK